MEYTVLVRLVVIGFRRLERYVRAKIRVKIVDFLLRGQTCNDFQRHAREQKNRVVVAWG